MKTILILAVTILSTQVFAKDCARQARSIGQAKANEFIARLNEGYKMFDSIAIKGQKASYVQENESKTKTYFYEAEVKYVSSEFSSFDAQVAIELDSKCQLVSSNVQEISAE